MFEKAVSLHQKGQLDEAEHLYRKILAQNPKNAEALHLLGVIEAQRKNFAAGVEIFDRAIKIQPNNAAFLSSRGNALRGLGQLNEALAAYDSALAIKPDYAEALNNRGVVLQGLRRPDEAIASLNQALAIKPDYAEAFSNRGNLLQELGRLDEALASYDRALAINPNYAEVHYNRGSTLQGLKRLDEALSSYYRALTIRPQFAEAHLHRGNALEELKRLDEALAAYDRALAIKPNYPEALYNRGHALHDLRQLDKALASYDRALALKPDDAEVFFNRGLTRLLSGHFQAGWADYEWRWQTKDFLGRRPDLDAPHWRGEDIAGRSILVFTEQGIGDLVQFARFLPLLAGRGAKVTFRAPANMIRLLRPLGTQIELAGLMRHGGSYDFQCALMSLPRWFGTDLNSIPAEIPYLEPEAGLAARWKRRIGDQGFKIGIAWQGNPTGKIDQGRSYPLSELVPLARVPGVRLISLQKYHGLDQLSGLPSDVTVETLGNDFDSGEDALIDTAAVMSHLDLIITMDTSIAHLAGALGRRTWVALKYVPDWRWLLERNDSPWYPSLRLFRQQTDGDWKGVFSRMESELHRCLMMR